MDAECARCDGTGWIEAGCWPCEECKGQGWLVTPPRFCMVNPDDEADQCDYPNCYCG